MKDNPPAYVPHDGMRLQSHPIMLHMYLKGSKDVVVTMDDKKSCLYFFDFPFSFTTYKINMHMGGNKEGQLLAKIKQHLYTFLINFEDGRVCEFNRKEFARNYKFSVNNKEYAWEGSVRIPGGDISFYKYPEKKVIATFLAPKFAISKMGKVVIEPEGQQMLDLLMASLYSIIVIERMGI